MSRVLTPVRRIYCLSKTSKIPSEDFRLAKPPRSPSLGKHKISSLRAKPSAFQVRGPCPLGSGWSQKNIFLALQRANLFFCE